MWRYRIIIIILIITTVGLLSFWLSRSEKSLTVSPSSVPSPSPSQTFKKPVFPSGAMVTKKPAYKLGVSLRPGEGTMPVFRVGSPGDLLVLARKFALSFEKTKKQLNISSVIISGAILGIAFMFRYQPILVLGAFVIFLLIRDKKIRINLLYALTMLLFFLAAASPVFFYNYSIHGTLIDSNPDYEYAFRIY